MLRFLAVLCLILILLAGGGIYGSYYFYARYYASQRIVSIYIDKCGQLAGGFAEARQLVLELGKRNKAIAIAAREGLDIIEGKFKTENKIGD